MREDLNTNVKNNSTIIQKLKKKELRKADTKSKKDSSRSK
jgi:hypothetical protein